MTKVIKNYLRFGNYFGSEIATPIYRYIGDEKGLSVHIQGGIHGGETTYLIFNKLHKFLRKTNLLGSVTLVPIANPLSWFQRQYFFTTGKYNLYDGRDWNRNFPSSNKIDGPASVIANALFNLACKSQIVIDLHTTRVSAPFAIFNSLDQRTFIRRVGAKYNLILNKDKYHDNNLPFSLAAYNYGIESFAIECGSHDTLNKKHIEEVLGIITNALATKKLIQSKTSRSNKHIYYYKKYLNYYSPETGIVDFKIKPGESYNKNSLLFTIYPTNELKEKLKIYSREAGIVIKRSPTHVVWKGDSVMQNVDLNCLKKLI